MVNDLFNISNFLQPNSLLPTESNQLFFHSFTSFWTCYLFNTLKKVSCWSVASRQLQLMEIKKRFNPFLKIENYTTLMFKEVGVLNF